MTNTGHGKISGQTHIKNYRLDMKPFKCCPDSYHLTKGNGAKLIYKKNQAAIIDGEVEQVYYLDQETLPNGNQRQYSYDLGKEQITEIKSLNRKGKSDPDFKAGRAKDTIPPLSFP